MRREYKLDRTRRGSQHKSLKTAAGRASGLHQMPLVAFSVCENRVGLCMEICGELMYNFN